VARRDGVQGEHAAPLFEAASERRIRYEVGRVEVDERKASETGGEVRGEAHREATLHHAADHQRQPRGSRDGRHGARLHDPGLHHLQVHRAGDAAPREGEHVLCAARRLVGADGHRQAARELEETRPIRARYGLLEERQRDALGRESRDETTGAVHVVATVCVGVEAEPGRPRGGRHDARGVLLRAERADLDLQRLDAPRRDGHGASARVLDVARGDRHVGLEHAPGAAEMGPEGQPVEPGEGVEERHLEGGARRGGFRDRGAEGRGQGTERADVVVHEATRAFAQRGERARLCLAAHRFERRGLAEAHDAPREVDTHEHVGRNRGRTPRDGEGLGERQIQGDRVDGDDLVGGAHGLSFRPARGRRAR
jgi:hypothetical protein